MIAAKSHAIDCLLRALRLPVWVLFGQVKQAQNAMFNFLLPDDPLYAYYTFLKVGDRTMRAIVCSGCADHVRKGED
jgi:hypothetical protein